jgi:hypothetical protein
VHITRKKSSEINLQRQRLKFVQHLINEEQAKKIFSKQQTVLRKKRGEIIKIELIHLPCYVFEVTVKIRKEERKNYVLVDGIKGIFSFLNLENAVFLEEVNPSFYFEIKEKEARGIAKTEYKGEILRSGLIAKNPAELKEISKGEKMYYPFWICYYKKRKIYNFDAIDGISGKRQGVKMNPVFLHAFHQQKEREVCMN